jgi:hypothetical protein
MPAYFVGWHGFLSLGFGWYLIRKWLLEGKSGSLAISSLMLGLFWGTWSLSYRLPETIKEFEAYVQAGESWLPGAWPFQDFLFYTVVFTLMLMVAHWLLGRGLWRTSLGLKIWEIVLLGGIILVIYSSQVLPVVPLGFLKLSGLAALVLLPLWISSRRSGEPGILVTLAGGFNLSRTAPLLLIPISASLVYGLAEIFPLPLDLLQAITSIMYPLPALLGGGLFSWAWIDTIRKKKSPSQQLP